MKSQRLLALTTALIAVTVLAVVALPTEAADSNPGSSPADASALPPPSNGAISPQDQADALHFVIAADREALCGLFLSHVPAESRKAAPGNEWACPSVALRRACESIQSQGAEFSYALRSLTPMEPRNSPQTELEQTGLAFIASHPGQNYYGRELLGGRRYFTGVYPDLPAKVSCVDCHNRNIGTATRLHKSGDTLGGVVVRVPLEF